ncbi:hypothetical protein DOTSEDRAFT_71336 [Dothistroma septosporum NZE10]|uniref:Secreted protein n=1 Tax=Dothistroma septosporum (strain NZE10 / CBS 128990) TaxID=675120 RepID=N1PQ93_DOTSN|nr:hypothetical protein DOTSEDRAFT_71336 [Dothistroma septosporum NZE10]
MATMSHSGLFGFLCSLIVASSPSPNIGDMITPEIPSWQYALSYSLVVFPLCLQRCFSLLSTFVASLQFAQHVKPDLSDTV